MGGQPKLQTAIGPHAQNEAIPDVRSAPEQRVRPSRSERTRFEGQAHHRSALSDQVAGLQARKRELAIEAEQLRGERRRLERDLHDGVQSELVALIVELALVQQDPDTPPGLAEMLAGLEARTQATLDSVRNVVGGIFPPLLADFGVQAALRARAARAPTAVSVRGTVPRSTEEAEEAVYFACSEAIQNVAKHAGRQAQVTLRLHHDRGSLAVRIEDDGSGFDRVHTPEGTGLRNIRDRIQHLGGTVDVTSTPGHGTVLIIFLLWPSRADR